MSLQAAFPRPQRGELHLNTPASTGCPAVLWVLGPGSLFSPFCHWGEKGGLSVLDRVAFQNSDPPTQTKEWGTILPCSPAWSVWPLVPMFCGEFLWRPKQGCHDGGNVGSASLASSPCSQQALEQLLPSAAACTPAARSCRVFPRPRPPESGSWQQRENFWEGCEMDAWNIPKSSKTKGSRLPEFAPTRSSERQLAIKRSPCFKLVHLFSHMVILHDR